MYDLSVQVVDNDVTWVLSPPVKITRRRVIGPGSTQLVNAEDISTPVHFGTHVDFPFHNLPDGKTSDQYPITSFIGRGNFIDLSYKKPNDIVTVADLEGKDIQAGDVVLFFFDWFKYRGRNDTYLYDYPGLNVESARYLASKKIAGMGTDAYNIEQTPRNKVEGPFPAHVELMSSGAWAIEALGDIKPYLGRKDLLVAAFPLSIKGLSGSPARVVALEFEQ